jgi:hypothetical protein
MRKRRAEEKERMFDACAGDSGIPPGPREMTTIEGGRRAATVRRHEESCKGRQRAKNEQLGRTVARENSV